MTFSGRPAAAGGFSEQSNAAMNQMLRQLEQETGANTSSSRVLDIRQSGDYTELEQLRRELETKRARVGNAGLTSEERQQLSLIQRRQREMRVADARNEQRSRRQNRQAVPRSVDDLEISPRQAEALIALKYPPTAQGYLDAADDLGLQVVGIEEGRKYDWQGEIAGLRQVERRSLIDQEGDNAARLQNFGGTVGEGNRAKEGKEGVAVQERADAEYARGEQDWDAKRERRQGTFRMPPRDGRTGARPLGIEGFVAEQINVGNVDIPLGAQRGDAMHLAAVAEERQARAAQLQRSVERGFAFDTDDIVGEGFKAQDFGMERMDDKQIKLNRDFQRKIRNEDGSQAVDSRGRKRFRGANEDRVGNDRNFRDVNVLGNAGDSPVRDAIARLESAIASGELDPNMPLDYQSMSEAGMGDRFNRVNTAIRKGPTPTQAADFEYRIQDLQRRAEGGDSKAAQMLSRLQASNSSSGPKPDFKNASYENNQFIDDQLKRDLGFGLENSRPEGRAAEEANRRRVLGDSKERTVGELLDDLYEQVDGGRGVAAERSEAAALAQRDRQAAAGQLDAFQRKAVIDGIERQENLASRRPIRPFEREVNVGMDPLQVEVERRQGVKAARDAAGIRQVFAVDNEGGRQKNVQEMMLKQALEQGGFEPRSVPSFGESGAAPALQFTPEQRAVLDQRLIDRAPQAARDFNNRRLVNDAKAGIEVANIQINALARAARRKGSPLTSDEKGRILGALTQEIYPNQQIQGVSGKAQFGRELVKGNFDNRLQSFDYNVQLQPPVGNATPMYDTAGEVVGFVDPVNGQQLGAVEGTFDRDRNEWVTPAAAREMQELGDRARAAQSWVDSAVYDSFDIQNGDTFDRNWPRQAVAQPLANVADKLRSVGFVGDIKNMDDLGRAYDMYVQAKGVPQRFDAERGAKVAVSDPNIGDMLDALHLSANEKKEVARAIDIQQKALDQRGINASDKDAFLIGNDAGRNRALRIEGTKRRAVKQAEAIKGRTLTPMEQNQVEVQAMKQLAPVQQAARDTTMNVVGGAAFVDGQKLDRNGKLVDNRVGIAAQLRGLDPVARVNQEIEAEIQDLEFARGERLSNEERLGVRQRLEMQNGIDEIDLWVADARKPFIGAIGKDNKGGRAPREGANVQAGVMRVNINDDDAGIRQELAARAARQRGNRGPRIFEIQGRRNLRDAVRADQAAAAIQQPIIRRGSASSTNAPLPTDLQAFGNQNRQMVERWQGMEASAEAPMLIDRLSPREARERRILGEQRAQGITGPVAPNPNLEAVNAFDLRNRQAGDPAGMQRGGFNNGPFVGEGDRVPMMSPVNDRIDNMADQIIGRSPAPVIMPRSQSTGIGPMPVATQAPSQAATSQGLSGRRNMVAGIELGSTEFRRPPTPARTNPSPMGDVWSSAAATPAEAVTYESARRFGSSPSVADPWAGSETTPRRSTAQRSRSTQRALPPGISTRGPSQDVTRPLNNELKNALAELSSGFTEQGPRPSVYSRDPGITPDGISSPVSKEARRRKARTPEARDFRATRRRVSRYGRGAAVAGGVGAAIAGIDGLIGGERDRREEEKQEQMAAYMR